MKLTLLKSKIHRATVFSANPNYEGSLTIDALLMDRAEIRPWEQIHVWDVDNGNRIITYAIPGQAESGIIEVNGAGAKLIHPGDCIIIATFCDLSRIEVAKHNPIIVFVDKDNKIGKIGDH